MKTLFVSKCWQDECPFNYDTIFCNVDDNVDVADYDSEIPEDCPLKTEGGVIVKLG